MKKKKIFKNLRRVWKYFKSSRKYLILYATISIVEALLSVLLPLLSAKLLLSFADTLLDQLFYTSLAILIVYFIIESFVRLKSFTYNKIYLSAMVLLQKETAAEFLKLEIQEIDKNSSGMFIERINNDTGDIASVFMEYTYYFSYVLSNLGVLVSILFLNRYLFLYCLFIALVSYFLHKARLDKQFKIQKHLKKIREKKTGLTSEIVRGMRDIKVLNARDSVLDQAEERINEVADEELHLIKVRSNYNYVYGLFSAISSFVFIVLGIYLFKLELITIPVFLIVYNYLGRVRSLFNNIVRLLELNKTFTLAMERVFEIIDDGKFIKEKFGDKHVEKLNGDIEFKNVTFGYNEDKLVLNNMNFKINANEKVAFVGKSGAGKTTLFGLISRLYHTNSGEILFDGININELDEGSIRDNMSLITQNPYIFNFSIKENLLLAKSDATEEELINACKIACIHDYNDSLPDKYDTMIGENGVILSGGQRQRLAIARALLMKTEIILFDEATSALDNETQEEITKAIDNLKGEYTILIVAHRLSTVIDCDKIFVVDDGRVIAEGTHKSLMKKCEFYRDLYTSEL